LTMAIRQLPMVRKMAPNCFFAGGLIVKRPEQYAVGKRGGGGVFGGSHSRTRRRHPLFCLGSFDAGFL
jgi:hypothetical protein